MTDFNPTEPNANVNVVDRAAQSADKALEATRRAAGVAIDSMADKMHGLRDSVSPVADRIAAPFDAMAEYTQQAPLKSLLVAAAVGAGLMAVLALLARSRH